MQKKKFSLTQLIFMALMAAVMCIAGPLAVPIGPVPITLTNLVIYIAVGVLGTAQGTISYCLYLLLGMVGLPVFFRLCRWTWQTCRTDRRISDWLYCNGTDWWNCDGSITQKTDSDTDWLVYRNCSRLFAWNTVVYVYHAHDIYADYGSVCFSIYYW